MVAHGPGVHVLYTSVPKIYSKLNDGKKEINVNNKPLCRGLLLSFAQRNKVRA